MTVVLRAGGLMIEQLHLAPPAVLEEADDGVGGCGVMECVRRICPGGLLPLHEVRQGDRSEGGGRSGKKRPAILFEVKVGQHEERILVMETARWNRRDGSGIQRT